MVEERSAADAPIDPFASLSRMRELVEQLPVVVYVDSDDRLPRTLYMTPNIEKLLGYPPERFIEDRELWGRLIHPEDRVQALDRWRRSWETGSRFRAEYRMIHRDGQDVWIRDSGMIVLSDADNRLAWQGVVEDLSREKRSEQEVSASEAKYRALVERIPAVVYEMGPDDERRTLYVSPHVEEVLGYTLEEWLEQPDIWIELLHGDDREIVLAAHDRHSETGEPWDREYRLIASDGRVVWVHDRASLIAGTDDRPPAWHGVMIDVSAEHEVRAMLLLNKEELERRVIERTNELREANELMSLEIGERRRMEAELRDARERYRRLVENVPGIVYTWDVSDREGSRSFSYISPQVEDVLGFAPAGWNVSARLHPHDRARVRDAIARSARTGEALALEYRYLAQDGRVVWVLDQASLIARSERASPATFQGVMLDITALKDAQSKAEQAEDRFRALTETGPVVAYAYDLRREPDVWPPPIELTYMSPQMAEVVGFSSEELIVEPTLWRSLIHPDDRDATVAEFERSWRTGEDWDVRYRIIRRDGAVVWLRSFGRMLARDEAGRPWRFQGVLFDITEEQDQLERLTRAEEGQRTALEGVRAIPWTETIDPESGFERYTYIGPQVAELLGYTPEELMVERKHFPRMLYRDDRARIRRSTKRAALTGLWEAEYRVVARDGRIRWLHSFARRSSPPGTTPELWHGVTVDVTSSRAHVEDRHEVAERASVEDPGRS